MQLGIAILNYESSHERLPPGVVNDTGPVLDLPKGYHFGWLTQILPYCDQKNIYNHFNFKLGLYEAAESHDADDREPHVPLSFRSRTQSWGQHGRHDELCGHAQ